MNKKGFISIFVLFTYLLVIMISLYTLHLATLQMSMAAGSQKKIQSMYLSEDKINKVFYNKDYYMEYIEPILLKDFRTSSVLSLAERTLTIEGLEEGDSDKVVINFEEKFGRKYFTLETSSTYKKIKTNAAANGTLVNNLFEMGQAILSTSTLEGENLDNFISIMEDTSEMIKAVDKFNPTMVAVNIEDGGDFQINNIADSIKDYKEFISIDSSGMSKITDFRESKALFIIRNKDKIPTSITFQPLENSVKVIKMKALIYIEGDIIINGDLDFSGIIIVNNGSIIVNTINKPTIKGMVFLSDGSEIDLDNINIQYNKEMVYLMGSYIPSFLDPKIEVIKKY